LAPIDGVDSRAESAGVSPEEIAAANEAVRIPMKGSTESLNVAVAAGILLYEAHRQRELVSKGGSLLDLLRKRALRRSAYRITEHATLVHPFFFRPSLVSAHLSNIKR
jgi:tRNA C32,U32 (ribose-2'-O)-methylase TrmJ